MVHQSDNEWQRVTRNENELQILITSDNRRQWVTTSDITTDNEWYNEREQTTANESKQKRVILGFKWNKMSIWFLKVFIQFFMQCVTTIYLAILKNREVEDIYFRYVVFLPYKYFFMFFAISFAEIYTFMLRFIKTR